MFVYGEDYIMQSKETKKVYDWKYKSLQTIIIIINRPAEQKTGYKKGS